MKKNQGLAKIALITVTLLIGACAQQQTRDSRKQVADPVPRSTTPVRPSEPAAAPTPPAASAPATRSTTAPSQPVDQNAQFTGIVVCDEYLATYRECSSVITKFTLAQIDERLTELRSVWQADAKDPAKRAQLERNCQNLTNLRDEALDDRDCELRDSDFVEPERTDFDNVEGDSTIAND